MTMMKNLALTLVALFCGLVITAQGQTARLSTVNVTSDGERVHIAAQGDASEMRVEVSDEAGDIIFQSGAISGQTLDWKMRDAQGARVSAGTYLVTVTFRTPAGKLRKRIEQVTVDEAEKENAPRPSAPSTTLPVQTTGTVTVGRLSKFASIGTNAVAITNSVITESGGRIGIGTSSPQSKLQVYAYGYGITHSYGAVTVGSYVNSSGGWLGTKSNHPLYFFTNDSAPLMTIDINGHVGIGETNPTQGKLVVNGGQDDGVVGRSSSGIGTTGTSTGGTGVFGNSDSGFGVFGSSVSRVGVEGNSDRSDGVQGESFGSGGVGVKGINSHGGYAGLFQGRVRITSIPNTNGTDTGDVCFNPQGDLMNCRTSSLRYKTNVQTFSGGLDIVRRLRPISFNWKESGIHDIGLAAEEVATVAPEFTSTNNGEVVGVKYNRLNVLLINAIKEQQAEIEQLRARLRRVERTARRRQGSRRRYLR